LGGEKKHLPGLNVRRCFLDTIWSVAIVSKLVDVEATEVYPTLYNMTEIFNFEWLNQIIDIFE
jgi:hypothetical protein